MKFSKIKPPRFITASQVGPLLYFLSIKIKTKLFQMITIVKSRDIRQPYPRNGIIRPLFLQIENYES